MAKYGTAEIRNISLAGHGGTGKTILAEAMLFKSGSINRMGTVSDGNTASDFTPEEKDAGYSMHLGVMHCDHKGRRINILDCPGYPDFIAGAYQGVHVSDAVVICIAGSAGIQVNTRKMWKISTGKARVIAVTRMDAPQAGFSKVVEQAVKVFGSACAPLAWPTGGDGGDSFSGVINLLTAESLDGEAEVARVSLIENAVGTDDELMEMYLEEQPIPPDRLNAAVKTAILTGELVPIVPVASEKDAIGVETLLDLLADLCPSPADVKNVLIQGEGEEAEEIPVSPDENADFLAQVFRIKSDPHLRRLSFFRVYSGKLTAGSSAKVVGGGRAERIQQLLIFQGGRHIEIQACIPGDIVATSKIESFHVGDTLTTGSGTGKFAPLVFPVPMVRLAIEPKSRNDAAKCTERLRDLEGEDPTFTGRYDPITKELVISGVGNLHLESKLTAMKNAGVEVNRRSPKIPYKETITGTADVTYRHKKQSGGAGQFGQVSIRIEPNERGGDFEFIDEITGGVIPNSLIPSVEKGVIDKLEQGIVAGYPVVDLKVHLYDGKTHPVDSKDIAFRIAGREAIKRAVKEANPVLLEPIVKLEVTIPQQQMGDITGMISGKRGTTGGMEPLGDMMVVKALVPLAELQTFSSELKSVTGGAGSFMLELSHYEPVPFHVQQEIIKSASLKEDED